MVTLLLKFLAAIAIWSGVLHILMSNGVEVSTLSLTLIPTGLGLFIGVTHDSYR